MTRLMFAAALILAGCTPAPPAIELAPASECREIAAVSTAARLECPDGHVAQSCVVPAYVAARIEVLAPSDADPATVVLVCEGAS